MYGTCVRQDTVWLIGDRFFFFMLFNSRELLANSVWFNLNTSWGSSYELCMTAWPICRKICLWCKAGHVQAAGLRLRLSLLTAVVLAVVVLLDLFTYCSLIGNGGERFYKFSACIVYWSKGTVSGHLVNLVVVENNWCLFLSLCLSKNTSYNTIEATLWDDMLNRCYKWQRTTFPPPCYILCVNHEEVRNHLKFSLRCGIVTWDSPKDFSFCQECPEIISIWYLVLRWFWHRQASISWKLKN